MKRLFKITAVMLLAVMFSACGRQSGEAPTGQAEDTEQAEQMENPESAEQMESRGTAAGEESSGSPEAEEGGFGAGEDMEIQKEGDSVANNITFDFNTKRVKLNRG